MAMPIEDLRNKKSEEALEKHKFSQDILNDVKQLYKLNNWRGCIACAYDHIIIFLCVFLAEKFYPILPLAILVIGSRQRALATLLHEATHLCLAKNKALNKTLGTLFSGYLIFQSWESYRKTHVLNHHHFLGNQERDPDYKYYIESGVYENQPRKQFLRKHLWKPIFLCNTIKNIKYLITNRLLSGLKQRELMLILLSLAIYSLLGYSVAGWKFLLLYWLVPYLTSFQSLSWFIELAEHYPLLGNAKRDIFSSRNRFGGKIENFLTGAHGEQYHLIHHLFPKIPYWNMPKAHRILWRDRVYRTVNEKFGGIFTSSNNNLPLWRSDDFLMIHQ